MRKIRVTIARDGTQRIEVLDSAGPDCVDFTRDLERRLGKPRGERTLKPEHSAESDATELSRDREPSPDS